jgi:Flp pilus assembly protein TadG
MRLRPSRTIRDASGASLTEFALVSPLVFLLLFGLIDVGRFLWGGMVVGNAARAGALYGAQDNTHANDVAGIRAAVLADAAQISPTVSPSPYCACDSATGTAVTCTGTPCAASDTKDLFISVTASYDFKPLIKWPGLPASLTVSKTNVEQVSTSY